MRGVTAMGENVSVSVKFSGRLKRLTNIDRQAIHNTIQALVSKHGRVIRSGAINLDLKQNSTKQAPLFECKAKLWDKGMQVLGTGNEYGIWQTVDRALHVIERKIVQNKERNLGL